MTWCKAWYKDPTEWNPIRACDVYKGYSRKDALDVAKYYAKQEQKTVIVKCEFPCRRGGLTADWYDVHPDGTVIQTGEGVR